ncbi:MAG: HAMP domain-containing sensor histidine kinase [Pseudomonadota bacterium]
METELVDPLERFVLGAIPGAYVVLSEVGSVLSAFGDSWNLLNLSSEELIGSKIFETKRTPFKQRSFQACFEKKDTLVVVTPVAGKQFECTYKYLQRSAVSRTPVVLCIAKDKTNEMLLDKKIIDSTFELATVSRIQSLEKLAAGFAHEINNPLTIVQGQANSLNNLLKKGLLTIENSQKHIDSLNRNVARIAHIVRSLRDAASSDSDEEVTNVSLDEVVKKALEFARNQKNTTQISIEMSNQILDGSVQGREMQLVGAVEQLLLNSIDAAERYAEKWIKVDICKMEDDLVIMVTDSGSGISEDLRHKIMLPFFTTRDVGKGSGVGLNLAKRNVEANGGFLALDVGCKNTRFVIRFPRKVRDFVS